MDPIKASFMLVKVEEDQWDVLIFAEEAVLKAFTKTYPNVFYVQESVFNKSPMVVVPDFPNQEHAKVWKEYWQIALADPGKSCDNCPAVNEFFRHVEQGRRKLGNK
jgi:hypothetical protein